MQDAKRIFETPEEREKYLNKMNMMHEKYASLESKISQMMQKKWSTKKVMHDIENVQLERSQRKNYIHKKSEEKMKRNIPKND